jgi:hypothetical protein
MMMMMMMMMLMIKWVIRVKEYLGGKQRMSVKVDKTSLLSLEMF